MCERNFCDYDKYYSDQAGGRLDISYYKGLPYQRGRGKFTNLARRYGIPVLKYILKQGWELGKDMYGDIVAGKKVAPSFKTQMRKRASTAMKDLGEHISQEGSGMRKRPKLDKKRRKVKKKIISHKATHKKASKTKKLKIKSKAKRVSRKSRSKFDIFKNVI